MEADILVEIRPRAVQFMVALDFRLRLGDAAQVKPGADDALETAARVSQGRAQSPQRIQRLRINATHRSARRYPGTINPANAVIADRQRLRAKVLDPHVLPPDSPGLDRQSRAAARRLQHIVGHRQLGTVQLRERPLALRLVPRVLQENRLNGDRHRLGLLSRTVRMTDKTSRTCSRTLPEPRGVITSARRTESPKST